MSAPTVTSVSPILGVGGTTIEVVGTGFSTATAVYFGSTAAVYFSASDDSDLTAVAPLVPSGGVVDITVVNPSGTSATSSADHFNLIPVTPPYACFITVGGYADGWSQGSAYYGVPGVQLNYIVLDSLNRTVLCYSGTDGSAHIPGNIGFDFAPLSFADALDPDNMRAKLQNYMLAAFLGEIPPYTPPFNYSPPSPLIALPSLTANNISFIWL